MPQLPGVAALMPARFALGLSAPFRRLPAFFLCNAPGSAKSVMNRWRATCFWRELKKASVGSAGDLFLRYGDQIYQAARLKSGFTFIFHFLSSHSGT